ncbi:HET-domain-containing protein, partial [Massarina eburnea CBS 473.64]
MFSEPAKNTFRYEQLPDPASYIRLVKISPSTESSETTPHISILTTPFNDAPHYHAVSYTWGPTTDPGTIIIGENEAEIYVRRNCINVLRQITHFKTCEYYWIDALCINQADNDEKSYQVAMMGEIFSRADRVLACVG